MSGDADVARISSATKVAENLVARMLVILDPTLMSEGLRLWRTRRRHDHIDAVLRDESSRWILEYTRNNRVLLTRPYPTEEAAREDAAARLKDLLRAGWVDHW